jgi:hypothetical protein
MVHKYSEKNYLKAMIGDINVNDAVYKQEVITLIKQSGLSEKDKMRFLATATQVKPDSFVWKESWDKGALF